VSEQAATEPKGQTPTGETREITLRIDESEMDSQYANTIRTYSTMDEVFLNFGVNTPIPGKADEIVFKAKHQAILNWRTAKRLALTLSNLVRQHEEHFGEIEPTRKAKKEGE